MTAQLQTAQLQIEPSDPTFGAELLAVEEKLTSVLAGIYSPLSILVRKQIAEANPHRRAAIVLTVATASNDSDTLKESRIYLAAALEMLYIALQIHQLLLHKRMAMLDDTIDKSILGSTILAGDYCFSHAASLAACTNSPEVVAIFSEVLRVISETQLRGLFIQDGKNEQRIEQANREDYTGQSFINASIHASFDPSVPLCKAGIRAASALVALPENAHNVYEALVDEIFAGKLHSFDQTELATLTLSAPQTRQWQALFHWLSSTNLQFQTKR